MGKFSLENKIKERLKGHEVHVDKRELWKALGIEEEEKDRKAIWFWWMAGFIGILVVGGLWWNLQMTDAELPIDQSISVVDIDENIAKTGNETLEESSTISTLSEIINAAESQENDIPEAGNASDNKPIINKSKSGSGIDVAKEVVTNNTAFGATHFNSTTTTTTNDLKNIYSKNEVDEIQNTDAAKTKKIEVIINKLPLNFSLLDFDRKLDSPEIENIPLIQPIAKTRKFEIELYGGIGTVNRKLSSEYPELSGYISGRDSSEAVLEHVSLGASFKYIFGGGFYGKAGLSFNRWNEKYTYNIVTDTTEMMEQVPEVITFDLQGNSTTKYTEGIQTTYHTTNWIRYNRLTQIDVPISLGYEHRLNRWSLFGEASAIVNIKQKFKGYLNTDLGKATKDPEIFRARIGINMGLNAGVGYGITPRLRARLSARYYRSFGSVLLGETDLDQRYSSIGLRLGFGYLL